MSVERRLLLHRPTGGIHGSGGRPGGSPKELDAPVFVGKPADEPFAFEGVEAVDRRFVRGDLAAELDFPDEGGAAEILEIPLDKLEDCLLFLGEQVFHGESPSGF